MNLSPKEAIDIIDKLSGKMSGLTISESRYFDAAIVAIKSCLAPKIQAPEIPVPAPQVDKDLLS